MIRRLDEATTTACDVLGNGALSVEEQHATNHDDPRL
jgi:hypothetical protein